MKWSTKIALLYIGFATMILGLAAASIQQNFQLVHKDYYAQELVYENRIQAIKNAKAYPAHIKYQHPNIYFSFPLEIKGAQLHLYRPSDSRLDQKIDLQTSSGGKESLDVSALATGRWQLRLSWQDKDQEKDHFQVYDFIIQ